MPTQNRQQPITLFQKKTSQEILHDFAIGALLDGISVIAKNIATNVYEIEEMAGISAVLSSPKFFDHYPTTH